MLVSWSQRKALSLYSTATQNTWRRGLALGNAPNARILRWGYQHVGILQPTQTLASGVKTLASGVICVTPNANPRRQSVEYRWHWASGVGAGVGHVHFMFFVLISLTFSSQRKPSFRWNMGFKFALPPTPNPDASQWNIGCVGSLALGLCVGHVHFIFFVLISFALGSRRKHSFQWNMGLNKMYADHDNYSKLSQLTFLSLPVVKVGVIPLRACFQLWSSRFINMCSCKDPDPIC